MWNAITQSKIWGTVDSTSTKTLDMHISCCVKIGDVFINPRYITTVRGIGFRFELKQVGTRRSKTLTVVFFILVVVVVVVVFPCGLVISNYVINKHQDYNAENASNITLRVDSLLNRGLPVDEQVITRVLDSTSQV